MEISRKKPSLLKAKCPVCCTKVETAEFKIERASFWSGGKHIFSCPSCNTELTLSPKLYKYINIFIVYFVTVFFGGLALSFIVTDSTYVMYGMLISYLGLIPLIVLVFLNNKAIKNENT